MYIQFGTLALELMAVASFNPPTLLRGQHLCLVVSAATCVSWRLFGSYSDHFLQKRFMLWSIDIIHQITGWLTGPDYFSRCHEHIVLTCFDPLAKQVFEVHDLIAQALPAPFWENVI